jgi:acetyl-CoA carboxylase carboxyl transferase subunit alpha
MRLAEKFGFPVVTLIDTPGADPTLPSEERGQAWAIAANLFAMAQLRVPIVAVVTGEGGSGGALAIGVGDRVLMMENAIYSVVSPEGCASILWRDSSLAPKAAAAMKVTAQDLLDGGIIDAIVPEPPGGAHVDPAAAAASLREALLTQLDELSCRYRVGTGWCVDELLAHRFVRYRRLGVFVE